MTVNHDFYRFLAARRGWFTLRAVPLHWLYFGYCGFCVAWGTLLHVLAKDPGRCLTGVDSRSKGTPEFVAIDEQPNDESVRRMNRLILVRKLMGLLSIVCVFSLPT